MPGQVERRRGFFIGRPGHRNLMLQPFQRLVAHPLERLHPEAVFLSQPQYELVAPQHLVIRVEIDRVQLLLLHRAILQC